MWDLLLRTGATACCICGEEMEEGNYSVEHKIPWLHTEDPLATYMNIENIGYAHHRCNVRLARKKKTGFNQAEYIKEWRRKRRESKTSEELKTERREKYLRYGK